MTTPHSPAIKRFFSKRFLKALPAVLILGLLVAGISARAQDEGDPPERVARLSVLQGNVSLEPAGVSQFSQAEVNYPLTTGDRIYVDNSSRAELETAGVAVRLANGADLTLTTLTDYFAQFGLAQGSIHLRSWRLASGAVIEIDTPNGTMTVTRAGDIRIDSYPQDNTTLLTVNSGQVEVSGPNFSQYASDGQALKLTGSNPIYAQVVQLYPPDDFDRFDQQRDQAERGARGGQQQYVNEDMIGYGDLAGYGDWTPVPEYGTVWYPRGVVAGWTPYHYGHWAWIAPWGWTWVESEPWGFAPFHYGRWAVIGGRWGWIPGPPVVRPVYSPALVVFVGSPNLSVSINIGGGGGVAAWFPLGPREPYVPWYHASPGYVNRVNVTNIHNTNITEVRNIYVNKTTNVYVNNTTVNNVTYVNRTVATTAVPQRAFAAGRPVAQAAVHVDERQLAQAPVIQHPMVTPLRPIVTPAPPRAVPANLSRPVLQTRANLGQGAAGVQARPMPGRVATPAPQPIPQQSIQHPAAAETPRQTAAPGPQTQPRPVTPEQPARPNQPAEVNRPDVQRNAPQPQPAPAATQRPAPQGRPASQSAPLVNRNEPPAPQPSFTQQQRAIQHTDPGRPLGPQQVENVRNGRPAGPPQQEEVIAHPAGQRPAPPPARNQPQGHEEQKRER